jgi:hypothetical protein
VGGGGTGVGYGEVEGDEGEAIKAGEGGGMSRVARKRAWKKGVGRRRGSDGKFV